MEDKNINIKLTLQTDKAVQNLDKLKKSADKAEGSLKKAGKAGKDVDKAIPGVKDLDKAWEQFFNNLTDELGPAGTSLKKVFSAVKAAIPTVKALNKTAITGLKGITKALAATGLGALVVIIGEIAAHWKDIIGWLGIGKKAQEEYNKTVEASKNDIEELGVLEERNRAKLAAQGATEKELAEFDIQASQRKLDKIQEIIQETDKDHKLKKKYKKEQIQSLTDEWNAENHNLWLLKEKLKTVKEVAEINEENARKAEEEEKLRQEQEAAEQARQERLEKLRQTKTDLKNAFNNASETLKMLAEKEKEGLLKSTGGFFTDLLDPKTATKSTDEVVAYIEKAAKELNEKLGTDLKVTPGIYEGLLEGDKFAFNLQLEEQNADRERLFAEGQITLEENLQRELEIKKKAFENERELLLKRKEFLEENGFGQDLEKVNSDLKILEDKTATYIANQNARIAKAAADAKAKVEAEIAAQIEAQQEAEEKERESKRKKLESKYLAKDRALRDEEFDTSFRRGLFKRSREYEQNQLAQIKKQKEYYQELLDIEEDPETRASILDILQDL